ncbi:MAG TPA: hypothetical protein VGC41_20785 [Kofleriaceae bacterium]
MAPKKKAPAKKPAPKPTAKPKPKAKAKAPRGAPPKRNHRPQIADEMGLDEDDRPLVVNPLPKLDRLNNPDDIEVDEAAIDAGMTHGGTLETRAQELQVRGSGGRKRSGNRTKTAGRDKTKKR